MIFSFLDEISSQLVVVRMELESLEKVLSELTTNATRLPTRLGAALQRKRN
jgi:hypothetical protein